MSDDADAPRVLADTALDQLFRTARTHNALHGPVTDEQLHALYELMKCGPDLVELPAGTHPVPAQRRGEGEAEARALLRATATRP